MKKIHKNFKNNKGFTLIEMILVLFIVGLLMLLIIPNLASQRDAIEEQGDAAIRQTVETQMQLYQTVEGAPATVSQLLSEGYVTQEQHDKYLEVGGGN